MLHEKYSKNGLYFRLDLWQVPKREKVSEKRNEILGAKIKLKKKNKKLMSKVW